MPDVAGRWVRSLLGTLGREIIYFGGSRLHYNLTSGMFWRPRGSGRRLESVSTVPNLKIMSQLGKRCQLDLLRLGFAAGLAVLGFSQKKECITVYIHPSYLILKGGRNRWMRLDELG